MQDTPPLTHRTLMEKIIAAGCQYYNCTEDELKTRKFTDSRKIIFYLIRVNAMVKYTAIAKRFGKTDHSWAICMIQEIDSQKDIYTHISHDIKNIMAIVSTLV